MRLREKAVIGAVAALTVLGTTGVAQAASGSGSGAQRITVRDDCEVASFNAAVGPGTCVGDGDTTFDQFVGEVLALGEAPKWRFNPDDTHVDKGQALEVVNRGGEFHTFTKVDAFGPGCVPEINVLLGFDPGELPLQCADIPALFDTSGVPAGGTRTVSTADLAPGTTAKYQ